MNTTPCNTCEHKMNPQGGWCYMFEDEPGFDCKIHSEGEDDFERARTRFFEAADDWPYD